MNTGDKLPRKESEIQQEDRRSTVITLIPCSLTDMTFRVGLDYYSHWCSFFFFLYNGRACCAGIAIAEDAAGHILSRFQKWQRCHRFKQKQNPCYWTLHGNSVLRSRADCWRITEAINDVFDPPREIVPILADIRRLMPTFENVKFECWQGSWFSFCRLAGAAPVNNCNASDPIYCTPSSTPLIHNLICLSKKKKEKRMIHAAGTAGMSRSVRSASPGQRILLEAFHRFGPSESFLVLGIRWVGELRGKMRGAALHSWSLHG